MKGRLVIVSHQTPEKAQQLAALFLTACRRNGICAGEIHQQNDDFVFGVHGEPDVLTNVIQAAGNWADEEPGPTIRVALLE